MNHDDEYIELRDELAAIEMPCLSVHVDVVDLLRHFDDDEHRMMALLRRLHTELT